jgi:hypothetical protein
MGEHVNDGPWACEAINLCMNTHAKNPQPLTHSEGWVVCSTPSFISLPAKLMMPEL